MMHGEGMLCWSDDFGVCRYKALFFIGSNSAMPCCWPGSLAWLLQCEHVSQGTFEHNVFQGHGVLEWSVKAGAGEC